MTKGKKKANEIFNNSEPLFGKSKFAEAFPQIKKVSIEVLEYEDFMKKDDGYYPHHQVFNESNLSQYVDCSESSCKGGGFSLGSLLSEMVQNAKISMDDSTDCIGKIGSKRCTHTFDYKILIEYK